MSDGGNAPPVTAIGNPKLRDIVAAVTDLARPFSIYAGAITVCVATFSGGVTTEKMLIAAGLVGVYGVARSIDKFNETRGRT